MREGGKEGRREGGREGGRERGKGGREGRERGREGGREDGVGGIYIFFVFTLNIVFSSSGKTTPTKFPELPGLREESELRRVILTETPRPVEHFVGESCEREEVEER